MKQILIVVFLLSFCGYSSKGQLMFQRSLEAVQGLICYGMVPTSSNGFMLSGQFWHSYTQHTNLLIVVK